MMNNSMEGIFSELSLESIVDSLDGTIPLLDDGFSPSGVLDNMFSPTSEAAALNLETPLSAATPPPKNARRSRGHRRAASDPEAVRRFAQMGAMGMDFTLQAAPAPRNDMAVSQVPVAPAPVPVPGPVGAQEAPMLDSFVAELDTCLGAGFGGLGVDLYPATIPAATPPSAVAGPPALVPIPVAPAAPLAPPPAPVDDTPKKRKRNHRRAASDPEALRLASAGLAMEQDVSMEVQPTGSRPRRQASVAAASKASAAASAAQAFSQSTAGAAPTKPKTSSRGRYKCGRCGQVKQGHRCILLVNEEGRVSQGSQVDLAVTRGTSFPPTYKTITVSRRSFSSEPAFPVNNGMAELTRKPLPMAM